MNHKLDYWKNVCGILNRLGPVLLSFSGKSSKDSWELMNAIPFQDQLPWLMIYYIRSAWQGFGSAKLLEASLVSDRASASQLQD